MGSKQFKDITGTQTVFNDTDIFPLQQADATTKKTVWSTIKSQLKAYFDSIYSPYTIGIMYPYAGITSPTGFLLCDGSSVSRTTYAALFAAICPTKTTTVANATEIWTATAHGLTAIHNGMKCFLKNTGGALPTGVSADTVYYFCYIGANTFYLCDTYANAIIGDGTGKKTVTDDGTGTHTLYLAPFGIPDANNFNVPNAQACVLRGFGTQTINTRAKSSAVLGVSEEDQMQTITGTLSTQLHAANGIGLIGTSGAFSAGSSASSNHPSSLSGPSSVADGATFSSATSSGARAGTTTRDNSLSINYIIKH